MRARLYLVADRLGARPRLHRIQNPIAQLEGERSPRMPSFGDCGAGDALEDPDLVGAENSGLRMNWGGIEGENALGLSGAAVLGRNVLSPNDRFAVSGAVGFGLQHDQVGGRVGAQLTWK